jgi:serine/threonine protein kinase
MIHQLAVRLKELHALGYVHRDLKPANVMWLPRENRWTVIDFGCAARTGEDAKLGFSIAYAAPEVIAAYRRGAFTMITQVHLLS